MLSLQGLLESHGRMIAFNTEVVKCVATSDGIVVETSDYNIMADRVINCAGFGAPAIATDLGVPAQSYFAKGHYYAYSGKPPFERLVYPVAEAGGLGVHVTLDLAGQVKFGPDVRWIDSLDYEFDESHFEDFVAAIAAYYPAVEADRLYPSYTGIRPKIGPAESGFHDFVIATPKEHG